MKNYSYKGATQTHLGSVWNKVHSKKATKFCEIFTLVLSYVVPVKSKVKISQNVAFSEYMNLKMLQILVTILTTQ